MYTVGTVVEIQSLYGKVFGFIIFRLLSNNKLQGPLPDLSGMNLLNYL